MSIVSDPVLIGGAAIPASSKEAQVQTLPLLAYPIPAGCHAIPAEELDLRSDAEIDQSLANPRPISTDYQKNIFFFWHSGYEFMHPYTKRNVRAHYRRLAKFGWNIYVINRVEGSPLNIVNFVDVTDPELFPKAFLDGRIGGDFAPQHTSDLVRWPLLMKYGGIYTDVGQLQIGDLNRLWEQTLGNPDSPYDIISYNLGPIDHRDLANYFYASRPNNPLFLRAHKLLLALWNADGGKLSTEGMHASPLLKGPKLIGQRFSEEIRKKLTDYIIQGYCLTLAMGLIDDEDGWDGPTYCAEHIYAIDYMVGSQLIQQYTNWNGKEAFRLLSLSLPEDGEDESDDQKKAREIVEACLSKSYSFKLAHGYIVQVFGDTLGSLWRKHDGSDYVPGTYAHWLREAMTYWTQDELPERLDFKVIEPYKRGPLLRES
ncbi:hypothetical protein F5B22DRAFT_336633 [Xylaria bambusicola]|uniref:uncharacterized protein n=1 Tax=Xylaria bambusicola TaxID=326684 RepID=UPI002007EF5A|nr:uncharacterized protein F5B22DRAFT_336633 [Xylaria bambusicola]KAI0525383.1 hypothetical protein F5B22DRAFT_336633 [Xylaria bambusicola]